MTTYILEVDTKSALATLCSLLSLGRMHQMSLYVPVIDNTDNYVSVRHYPHVACAMILVDIFVCSHVCNNMCHDMSLCM